MFTQQELQMIDRKYFTVIDTEDNVVTLVSKNTHHGWHIYKPNPKNWFGAPIIIFHKHENQKEYHKHGTTNTVKQALYQIREHDKFQIEVRWGGKSYQH